MSGLDELRQIDRDAAAAQEALRRQAAAMEQRQRAVEEARIRSEQELKVLEARWKADQEAIARRTAIMNEDRRKAAYKVISTCASTDKDVQRLLHDISFGFDGVGSTIEQCHQIYHGGDAGDAKVTRDPSLAGRNPDSKQQVHPVGKTAGILGLALKDTDPLPITVGEFKKIVLDGRQHYYELLRAFCDLSDHIRITTVDGAAVRTRHETELAKADAFQLRKKRKFDEIETKGDDVPDAALAEARALELSFGLAPDPVDAETKRVAAAASATIAAALRSRQKHPGCECGTNCATAKCKCASAAKACTEECRCRGSASCNNAINARHRVREMDLTLEA